MRVRCANHGLISLSLLLFFVIAGCNVDTTGNSGQSEKTGSAENTRSLTAPATSTAGLKSAETEQAPTPQPSGDVQTSHKSLDLSLKNDHAYSAAAPAEQYQESVLPEMFGHEKEKSKLSVSGSLLREEGVDDFANSVNGAVVSIELKTD